MIRIGASSATEMKETKERVDDALNTTRAIKEGVVVGGGLTLLKLSSLIDELPMQGEGVAGSRDYGFRLSRLLCIK